MSKLERLLNLTALLLNTERPLRIEEIGSLMEGYPSDPASFRRTFERDKDDLREMGIPVSVLDTDSTDTKTVGYRIRPDQYYLADPNLEPDELAALKLALGAVRLEGLAAEDTLRKLGGSAAGIDAGVAAGELASVPVSPFAAELFAAIGDRRSVEFGYREERRSVEPHRLDFQRGRWYLVGFDRLRQGQRSFRLDRISGPLTTGAKDAFVPVGGGEGLRFDPWRYGDDPEVTAKIRIDASQAPLNRNNVGGQSTWTDLEDGSAIVTMQVTDRHAFRSLVLGLLDHAEILEPEELRAEMVEWLRGCVR